MANNEEIKQLYNVKTIIPIPKDYRCCLEHAEIPKNDQPNDSNTITLKLPAKDREIAKALAELNINDISESCFYSFESETIPQLATAITIIMTFILLMILLIKLVN